MFSPNARRALDLASLKAAVGGLVDGEVAVAAVVGGVVVDDAAVERRDVWAKFLVVETRDAFDE